jgi:hypothetical protein
MSAALTIGRCFLEPFSNVTISATMIGESQKTNCAELVKSFEGEFMQLARSASLQL